MQSSITFLLSFSRIKQLKLTLSSLPLLFHDHQTSQNLWTKEKKQNSCRKPETEDNKKLLELNHK